MSEILDELIDLLSLERLEEDLFRGSSRDIGTKRVYGGQVLGQALKAAQYTVEDRTVHSLHAYFLRTGDHHAPIIYEVDRSRDGRSFSARRVVAIQHGRPIFTLAASFQLAEAGLEHQPDMPDVPNPDSASQHLIYSQADVDQMPDKLQRIVRLAAPFEFRTVEPIDLEQPVRSIPERHVWLRVAENCLTTHHCITPCLPISPTTRYCPPRCYRMACITTTSSYRWPALTTRCGFTERFAWTSGCCIRWTVPALRMREALRADSFIKLTGRWLCLPFRKA